jgi:hypothetical protein
MRSPTVLRTGGFRFSFFSREESRLHVHVSHADGELQFGTRPEISLVNRTGLPQHTVNEIEETICRHHEAITDVWHRHVTS